jgi:hypothetical protein
MDDMMIDLSTKMGREFYLGLYNQSLLPNPPYYNLSIFTKPFIDDKDKVYTKKYPLNVTKALRRSSPTGQLTPGLVKTKRVSPPKATKKVAKSPKKKSPKKGKLIDILFEGRKEVLNIIDHGGDIIEYLLKEDNPICRLIGSDIKLDKELGKGVAGTVFQINMKDGSGNKKFVAKRATVYVEVLKIRPKDVGMKYSTILRTNPIYKNANIHAILDYNKKKYDEVAKKEGEDLIIPDFILESCSSKITYERTDGKGLTDAPKGSLICLNTLTEFIVALLTGEIYRKGISINFIDSFYFATCVDGRAAKQYTFMEKITTSLEKAKIHDQDIINNVHLQTVHAIGVSQKYLNLVHGDLHLDNLFLTEIDKDTTWDNEKLGKYSYYEYKVGDSSLFINALHTQYIAKIGDFGLSVMYQKDKIIGNMKTLESGYDQYDGNGPWLPNFYNQAYDLVFFTGYLYINNKENKYLREIICWMLKLKKEISDADLLQAFYKVFGRSNVRPSQSSLTTIFTHVTPQNLLANKFLMRKFLDKPKGDGIILGYL